MERYAVIEEKFPREFVLLQGTGCRWGKCCFCDYHQDVSENPFEINRTVLLQVTGVHGVLDVINSGSGIELDEVTLALLQQVVRERHIHTLWFEMHYMYRHHLADFAARFAPCQVKFRCGIESFEPKLRERWNKGVACEVTPEDVARYFQGVCLLCCTKEDSQERILSDIAIAQSHFEYFSVNVFCQNSTFIQRDDHLVDWFVREVYPLLQEMPEAEVLLDNRDLGVG